MNGLPKKPKYVPLAETFGEIVAEMVPNTAVWPADTRRKFDSLYRRLSDIDERKACKP